MKKFYYLILLAIAIGVGILILNYIKNDQEKISVEIKNKVSVCDLQNTPTIPR